MAIDLAAQVRRNFEELWHRGNVDYLDEICGADFVAHDALAGDVDREGLKSIVRMFRDAIPDIRFRLDDVLVSGSYCTVRWTSTGTHRGQLMDIAPTGRSVEVRGIGIARYANDKEQENWEMWDVMGLMQQLGAVPVMGMPTSMHTPPAGKEAPRLEPRH
jgi:predicted ester cyclase